MNWFVHSDPEHYLAPQVMLVVKNPPANEGAIKETRAGSLGQEAPLE